MSDQQDDPPELRWHPSRHYDAAMEALIDSSFHTADPQTAIAHALLGLLRIEMYP